MGLAPHGTVGNAGLRGPCLINKNSKGQFPEASGGKENAHSGWLKRRCRFAGGINHGQCCGTERGLGRRSGSCGLVGDAGLRMGCCSHLQSQGRQFSEASGCVVLQHLWGPSFSTSGAQTFPPASCSEKYRAGGWETLEF